MDSRTRRVNTLRAVNDRKLRPVGLERNCLRLDVVNPVRGGQCIARGYAR